MAGFDTGGFAPMSSSIIYYHSFFLELVTMLVMCLGMLNFALHYMLWTGKRRELFKNAETRTLFVTIVATGLTAALALGQSGAYRGVLSVFRRGFYQIISAHTGTGFMTIYGRQFVLEWAPLAILACIVAMGLGGAACSTAGGIKALRVNLSARTIVRDAGRMLVPGSAVVVHKYHHGRDVPVTDKLIRSVFVVTFFYVLAYLGGAVVVAMYGNEMTQALFESTSACANVGLTVGITSPFMPALVKVVFIVQMWAGRLEFISVVLLFGMIYAAIRGR
jgi:trk system potassium uptake protein TrkH